MLRNISTFDVLTFIQMHTYKKHEWKWIPTGKKTF